MSAPTYHLHEGEMAVHLDSRYCTYDTPRVPAVVLTASDEDVKRLAQAVATLAEAREYDGSSALWDSRARRLIELLLTPPIPPEPTDLAWRGVDAKGVQWARRTDGYFASLGALHAADSWANLWSERGPLREVE